MPHCHDMKEGDIFVCLDCGLQIEVIKECKDYEPSKGECSCNECRFICCDEYMKLEK